MYMAAYGPRVHLRHSAVQSVARDTEVWADPVDPGPPRGATLQSGHSPGERALIAVSDRSRTIWHSYWLLETNPQSGPEFVQGPDAPTGHAASVADA
jgi:hypothetical protein